LANPQAPTPFSRLTSSTKQSQGNHHMNFIKDTLCSGIGFILFTLKFILIGWLGLMVFLFFNTLFWWLLALWFIRGLFFSHADHQD
jgi:hypothetical protein